jgi:tRNA pseudouridine38/39 synthase
VWKALVRCRLIFPPSLDGVELPVRGDFEGTLPPVDWEGCEYSKCGRTDKGVSAFGQVIGVRVRSARKAVLPPVVKGDGEEEGVVNGETEGDMAAALALDTHEEKDFDPIHDELRYIPLLNKVLPPSIRMLAWCPTAPSNFDARFSCKERQYRYFFTSPAFLPLPGSGGKDAYMDIAAMQEACGYLLGSHDFRNFCKVDPTKQLTSFTRRITHATVEKASSSEMPASVGSSAFGVTKDECDGTGPIQLYTFTVQGSAFLWHQVRCMVGILFLIGQGLEKPTLIRELLDVEKNPCKPTYEMASDKPLVLWNCTFSTSPLKGKFGKDDKPDGYVDRGGGSDELEWIYANDEAYGTGGKWGLNGLMENLWKGWRKTKMDEVLASQLMDLVAGQGGVLDAPSPNDVNPGIQKKLSTREKANNRATRVFEGDDSAPSRGKYIPVMQKEMMDPVHVINSRWMERKGIARGAFAGRVNSGNTTPA